MYEVKKTLNSVGKKTFIKYFFESGYFFKTTSSVVVAHGVGCGKKILWCKRIII